MTCEKKLRAALERLVGSSDPQEMVAMRQILAGVNGGEDAVHAIDVLLETRPPVDDNPLPPFCDGCGQEIDPDTCHCGSAMEGGREYHGHDAVPMGCRCLYDEQDWAAVAKGLRARLRDERTARGTP